MTLFDFYRTNLDVAKAKLNAIEGYEPDRKDKDYLVAWAEGIAHELAIKKGLRIY